MRAVVVTEYGGRAEAVDLPAPEVQAGQVLIKVLALTATSAVSKDANPFFIW